VKNVTVLAYRTENSFQTLDEAQERLEALSERFPDRNYTILFNARKFYRRFTVARVNLQEVSLPEEGLDYFMPPKPDSMNHYYDGEYDRFRSDLRHWTDTRKQKRGDPEGQVKL
jgi:hypothetical protein